MSDNTFLALGLIFLFVICPILIGKFLAWADNPPPRRLHRRPNVKLVRDEKDVA